LHSASLTAPATVREAVIDLRNPWYSQNWQSIPVSDGQSDAGCRAKKADGASISRHESLVDGEENRQRAMSLNITSNRHNCHKYDRVRCSNARRKT
jgi:hypothetical protein